MKGTKSVDEIKTLVAGYREEAVQLLQRALRTPSSTGEEKEMGKLFAKEMESFGLDVQRIEYEQDRTNLLAEWVGNSEGKKFIFNGHMDVYPPNNGNDGKFGPWSGHVADGKLYGRGAADMKSGDCAAMMAVRILKETGYVPDGEILLSYMVDEERSSEMGAVSLLNNGYMLGYDCGVCMEPTNNEALMEQGGIWQADVTYRCEGGHSTSDMGGKKDALQKALDAIEELYKLQAKVTQRTYSMLGQQHFKVNNLHAGQMGNTIPSMCTFGFDRRFSPGDSLDDVKREILDILDELKAKDPEYDYEIQELCQYPSFKMDADNTDVQLMISACSDIKGRPVKRFGWYAGTDSAHIMDRTSTQILVVGPGDVMQASMPDEHVPIDDYLDAIAIYIRIIDTIVGQKA